MSFTARSLHLLLDSPMIELAGVPVTLRLLLEIAAYLGALVLLARVVRSRLVRYLMRKTRADEGVQYAAAQIAGYAVWVLGALVGLPLVGLNLNSLLVALGAVGVGLGFGLQHMADNLVSGLVLLFERPVKVGDRIQLGDLTGTVKQIQKRASLVVTNENLTILVPNSELVRERVINLSNQERVVRYRFRVGVGYGSDVEDVRDALFAVARENSKVLEEPAPEVLFLGFGDSSLDFDLRVATSAAIHYPDILRSELYFAIWHEFKRRGIEIPFPQRDLHIRTLPKALLDPQPTALRPHQRAG